LRHRSSIIPSSTMHSPLVCYGPRSLSHQIPFDYFCQINSDIGFHTGLSPTPLRPSYTLPTFYNPYATITPLYITSFDAFLTPPATWIIHLAYLFSQYLCLLKRFAKYLATHSFLFDTFIRRTVIFLGFSDYNRDGNTAFAKPLPHHFIIRINSMPTHTLTDFLTLNYLYKLAYYKFNHFYLSITITKLLYRIIQTSYSNK
jgi:hypothetical protein